MNGIALLLNLDMVVMLVLAGMLVVAVTVKDVALPFSPETVARLLTGAAVVAVALISFHKFLRMEG